MFHKIDISSSEKVIYQHLSYNNYEGLERFLKKKNIDLSALKNISNFNRKYEWMSVRALIIQEMPDEDVIYNSNNKPFFKKSDAHLSISHSTNMIAVGINSQSEVGIDLQFITEKIIRIKQKFLDEREQSMCSNNPTELTCYWSVKEALFKLYGIKDAYLKENMKIVQLDFDGNSGTAIGKLDTNKSQAIYQFRLRKIDNYILAFSVNE